MILQQRWTLSSRTFYQIKIACLHCRTVTNSPLTLHLSRFILTWTRAKFQFNLPFSCVNHAASRYCNVLDKLSLAIRPWEPSYIIIPVLSICRIISLLRKKIYTRCSLSDQSRHAGTRHLITREDPKNDGRNSRSQVFPPAGRACLLFGHGLPWPPTTVTERHVTVPWQVRIVALRIAYEIGTAHHITPFHARSLCKEKKKPRRERTRERERKKERERERATCKPVAAYQQRDWGDRRRRRRRVVPGGGT